MASSASGPKNDNVDYLKSFLLQPALTSHYEVFIPQPPEKANKFIGGIIAGNKSDLFRLSCSEASLPGSSLTTHELNNDFTGVTQRHAYRRLYDDRADFTFYVNHTYDQIRYFERWIQFIVGEQIALKEQNTFYRAAYPKDYKTTIYITKFERTVKTKTGFGRENSTNGDYSGKKLTYEFIGAFPLSINSMPVSYDSSQLLKCTVSFAYDRYIMNDVSKLPGSSSDPSQSSATGVPNVGDTSSYWDSKANNFSVTDFATAANLDLGLNVSGTNAFNVAPSQNNRQVNIGAGTQAEVTQINSNIA